MNDRKQIAKKSSILYVLNIIKLYSSEEHPVSQSAICNFLNEINIPCDRKTVGRNIEYLQQFGYPIVKVPGKGFYIDKEALRSSKNKLVI